MRTLFFVLGLLFINISLFSATEQEIITKLKEIDKAMAQGSISYKNTVFNEKNVKKTSARSLVYDSKGRTKSTTEIIQPDNTKEYLFDYVDDKNNFIISTKSKSAEIVNKTDYVFITQFRFSGISANPSLQYGRGITLLENLKIDPIKNIATGNIGDYRIVAHLNPKLDYAAYKLERIFEVTHPGPRFLSKSEMNNSKPILIDGKYYIFSKSTRTYSNPDRRADSEIISATFKTPDEKDYIFDWNKNTFERITDARGSREQDLAVKYKKSELPEGITLDELLKITKRKVFIMKITNIYNKIVPDSAGLTRIILAVAVIVALIIFFRKRSKV